MQERRRHRRVKMAPVFRVKAKVTHLRSSKVYYFDVENLGMGGVRMCQRHDASMDLLVGDQIEVMIYRKNMSLKVMAQVLEGSGGESQTQSDQRGNLRAQIIGIDQKARETLVSFLTEMAESQDPPL